MRFICVLLVLVLVSIKPVLSQQKKCGEIGISIGGSYYLGDLNKIPLAGSRPSAGLFYRNTFNDRYAVRFAFNYLLLYANGKSSNIDALKGEEFSQSVLDFNTMMEFHFIPFIPADKKYKYSPYVMAGLSLSKLPKGNKDYLFSIPFGLGIKYNLNKRYTIAFETVFYKTFTDYIDSFYNESDDSTSSSSSANRQSYYQGNKDWFSFYGIKLTYKIKYKMKCPAFD